MRDEAWAYAGLTVAAAGWAAGFVIGKVVMAELPPLPAGALRYLMAALVLLPFAIGQRRELRGGVPWGALAVLVLSGGLVYQWLFLLALVHTTAVNTSLLVALNPVFTVMAAPLVGEAVARGQVAGVLLALAGAALVITRGDWIVLSGLAVNPGDVVALGAALAWTVFNLAAPPVMARLSPALVNLLVYGLGAGALAVLAWWEGSLHVLRSASPGAFAGIVAMALLSSVLAGQLFLIGVRRVGVSRAAVFAYLIPVLTAVMSTTTLREPFGMAEAVGGVAVLFGVYRSTERARPRT